MSPEQARGVEVDHRTDIWALGAMMYEMLTGERPFKKDQEHALIYSILNDNPTPITSLRADIPSHIEKVIEKALAKKADERYQNVDHIIFDLKQSPLITLPKAEKSIVVLPFEDISPGRDNEYFSDGLTEEIISDLSMIQNLLVISRSSAMTYKGTKKKIKEIGQELNVQYVLEGSVRKAGNNLRITAQLIDATNDVHLWAEKYGGTLDDVFDIQEKVSRSIVDALKIKLSPEEKKIMAERPIENLQAYECYMRARQEIYRLSEDSLDRALQLLQNGLDIIGENADLYAGMAQAHYWNYEMFYTQEEATLHKAKEYAMKAITLNPNSSMGYSLLGHYERVAGDSKEACKYMNKAVSIDPNNADILLQSVWMNALYVGKPDIAKPLAKRLLEIDPLTPLNYIGASFVPWMEGRFDLMEDLATKWYKMAPDTPLSALWYAWPLVWNNKNDEAIKFINETIEHVSHPVEIEYMLFLKYALQGQKSKALEKLTDQTKKLVWNDPGEGMWLTADIYALIDEKEQSLKWVERLIEKGWINYPLLNEIDPFLEIIRGEPRFKKLLERVKHEWENFEV
jgi:TolB-like protein